MALGKFGDDPKKLARALRWLLLPPDTNYFRICQPIEESEEQTLRRHVQNQLDAVSNLAELQQQTIAACQKRMAVLDSQPAKRAERDHMRRITEACNLLLQDVLAPHGAAVSAGAAHVPQGGAASSDQ
jgi:hypothetical protein